MSVNLKKKLKAIEIWLLVFFFVYICFLIFIIKNAEILF